MAFRFAAQSAFRPIARTVKAPVRRMGNDAPWPEQSAIIQKLEATPASVLIVGANIGAAAISLALCIIYNMNKSASSRPRARSLLSPVAAAVRGVRAGIAWQFCACLAHFQRGGRRGDIASRGDGANPSDPRLATHARPWLTSAVDSPHSCCVDARQTCRTPSRTRSGTRRAPSTASAWPRGAVARFGVASAVESSAESATRVA